MFSRIHVSESDAGRLLAIVAVVAMLSASIVSGGAVLAGLGLVDGGDVHGGVALAQSEEEEDSRTSGVTVPANGGGSSDGSDASNESDGSNESGETDEAGESDTAGEGGEGGEANESGGGTGPSSPTDQRAASATGGTADGVNDADGNRTAAEERADSQVPAGPNETGSERAGVDDTDDEDDGVGMIAQRFLDLISGLTTQAQNEVGGLMSMMLEYAVSRSAPGVADDPSSWGNPEDPTWQGAISVMNVTRLIGFLFGVAMVFGALGTYNLTPRESKRKILMAFPVGIFLAKPEFFVGLTLHGSTTISTTLSPSADAFATPEGMLAVGLSVIAAGLLAASSLWVIVLATVVTVISHEAGLVTTAFLPLAASFFLGPMYLKSIGEMVVYLHGVTVVMPIFQAIGTLAVVQMFFANGGVLTSLSGVLALLGTIYLLYYLFQREVLEKAFNAPIVSLGVHGAKTSADGARNVAQAPQAMRDIRASIESNLESARSRFSGSDGSDGGGSGGSWRPDIGKIQTPSISSGRKGSAAMADGGSDGSSAYPHAQSRGKQPDAASWGTRPVGRDEKGRFQSIDSLQENRERTRLANGDY